MINNVKQEIQKVIVGQEELVNSMLIALLSEGHVLVEGVPGIAKTTAVNSLAKSLGFDFKRIQFTPDLLPSDITGSEILDLKHNDFKIKHGPIFTNLLLADEINRAGAKVQSALLEAMAEKQITIWDESYKLDSPFIVLATQNPIEQSGTYKLPEAELDRFMMKSFVNYPTLEEEKEILTRLNSIENDHVEKVLSKKEILEIKELVEEIHVSENIIDYITDIIFETRKDNKYLSYWVSPRWSISLIKASKAVAFLNWRDFVLPEDVKEIAISVLSHRLVLNYEAIAEEIKSEEIIKTILENVKIK